MSEFHKNYLAHLKKYKTFICVIRIALFFSFIILWEVAANYHWIDSFFFSSPSRIIRCYIDSISNGELLIHMGYTLFETFVSFILVMAISIFIASLLWFYKPLADIFESTFVILNSLPKSALAPLFIVWLGTGTKTIIIAGLSVAIFGAIISIYTQFKQTDEDRQKLIQTLGGTKYDVYVRIVLPYSLKTIINSMKVNIGLSLVGVIIGEFLAARKGLGYLIIYGTQVFKLDIVISSIILLCFIAYVLYYLILVLEKRIPLITEDA